MSPFVAGVDGGGTGVRAVILNEQGREMARSAGAGAVVTSRDPGTAADAVASVVADAARKAGVEMPLAGLWAGLAGAGREPARSAVEDALGTAGLAKAVAVGTDLEAALHSALGDTAGILLLAGTGSVAVGRSQDGSQTRVGGWGESLGDEGGGFWIGLEALRRVVRAADGRGEATALGELVTTALEMGNASELVGWLEGASKADVGALAPVVIDAADSGDEVASAILEDAIGWLARHVLVLYQRAGPWSEPPRLALWGGLVAPGGPLRDEVLGALSSLEVEVLEGEVDPAFAAAEMALAMLRGTTT